MAEVAEVIDPADGTNLPGQRGRFVSKVFLMVELIHIHQGLQS